ncbi:YqiA/YcfP family alpha/beta fold hydrolase [Polynucleobacter sp. HIN7]|uniref:YqiA/YcfP family alpha/beta fold hydrolase n=1 Tax=Polynucleobacter sp. HIN7 TaxID=3047866 RepID=UPI0025722D97|nr:YqiA/YcfP family alpha/beta fold hydrolase [Polynucleobacter sp. HIN7]BEI37180.1 alpha/beta fold hydrolase [Polynucleobacter sp. HIN7]
MPDHPDLLIVYLHGFRSSPNSSKAQLTRDAIASLVEKGKSIDWYCPQLPPSPAEAIAMIRAKIETVNPKRISFIGSSLGGFYATHLAEQFPNARAVLLNPAVRAARELAPYVGQLTAYDSDEPFDWRAEYVEQLRAQQVEAVTHPERYLLVAATGDELLDWHEMVDFYPNANHVVIEGSDHGITEYPLYLDRVVHFASYLD